MAVWQWPSILEAKPRGVRVWRLFFRGLTYTKAYSEIHDAADVKALAKDEQPDKELIGVEAVT